MAYPLAALQLVAWVVAAGAVWAPLFWCESPAAGVPGPAGNGVDPLRRSRRLGVAAAASAFVLAVLELATTASALGATGDGGGGLALAVELAGSTRFGRIRLARALAALGLALTLGVVGRAGGADRRPGRLRAGARGWPAALALAGFATFSFSGHAMDVGQRALAVAVDLVHGVAAAAWAGVLAHLAASRWPPETPDAVACVGRFSGWAMSWLSVLGLTGAFGARAQLAGLAGVVFTPYGQLLALKMALLAGALAAAAVSLVVHSLRHWAPDRVARVVRRAVRVEAALALGVVVAAGLLRSTPPPVPASAVEARTFTWHVEGGPVRLTLHPMAAGPQGPVEVRFELRSPERPGGVPRLTLDMPDHPMLPVRVALHPRPAALPPGSGAGGTGDERRYEGHATLAMAGPWQGRLEWGDPREEPLPLTFTFTVEGARAPSGGFRVSLVDPWRFPRRAGLLAGACFLAGVAVAMGIRLFGRLATRPLVPLMAVPLGAAAFAFGQAAFFPATPATFETNPLPATPEVLARGATLVAQHCGPCAQWLAARPPGTDGDYFWWLREGYPSGSLAARKQALGRLLLDTDIWAMVRFARRGCAMAPPQVAGAAGGARSAGPSGCPAPDPAMALPASDAMRAGPYVVAIAVTPALPGANRLRVFLTDLFGKPVGGARVTARLAVLPWVGDERAAGPGGGAGETPWSELSEEEEGVYAGDMRTAVPHGGPEHRLVAEVAVQGPAGEASARFEWATPVRSARDLLGQAVRAMERLTALEEVQELDTGTARWRYRIRYRAPDVMSMTVFDERGLAQAEIRVAGSVQRERRAGGTWTERPWPGGSFRWPDYGYWQEFTNPLRLRTETVDGRPMVVVGAYHPASQTYWRLWVERGTARVHRVQMVGPAHFMTSVFEGFEPAAGSGDVEAEGAEGRAGVRARRQKAALAIDQEVEHP